MLTVFLSQRENQAARVRIMRFASDKNGYPVTFMQALQIMADQIEWGSLPDDTMIIGSITVGGIRLVKLHSMNFTPVAEGDVIPEVDLAEQTSGIVNIVAVDPRPLGISAPGNFAAVQAQFDDFSDFDPSVKAGGAYNPPPADDEAPTVLDIPVPAMASGYCSACGGEHGEHRRGCPR